jgi:hypothetical protein
MKGICFIEELFLKVPIGQKTMTRRIIKPQPDSRGLRTTNVMFEDWHGRQVKPRYNIGEIVYLKEPYAFIDDYFVQGAKQIVYKFDDNVHRYPSEKGFWKNKLFMPAKHARYFIQITDIGVERAQDISEKDAIAEGATDRLSITSLKILKGLNWLIKTPFLQHQFGFLFLWCKINGTKSWEENPWVFVYTFKFLPDFKLDLHITEKL